jgi:NIMA (never in mitosis gene a)-related kinase 1/4/5
MHARKVIHRDLKTANIFLTGDNTVKLGDLGISYILESTLGAAMTVVGTPYYMSPETCQSAPQTNKTDMWALGCIMHELCCLEYTFKADNLLGLVQKICSGKYLPIPTQYSPELAKIIDMLLQ